MYIDNSKINRKRFLSGILGGLLSVFPVLYMDKIFTFLDLQMGNIFYFSSKIGDLSSVFDLGLSMSIFLVVVLSLIILFYFRKISKLIKIYIINIIFFILVGFVISLLFYFINILSFYFEELNTLSDKGVVFGEVLFNSLKLIIFYYIIIGFIEETTKYFNFLGTSFLHIRSVKGAVLYSIFIALGFSFFENILYLYKNYMNSGINYELVKIYFLRSIFSVIVHVLCSSIVAYYFSQALLTYKENKKKSSFIKIGFIGLILGIFLHAIFNISLTLNFTYIIFIYIILGYLYITSIFYRD